MVETTAWDSPQYCSYTLMDYDSQWTLLLIHIDGLWLTVHNTAHTHWWTMTNSAQYSSYTLKNYDLQYTILLLHIGELWQTVDWWTVTDRR